MGKRVVEIGCGIGLGADFLMSRGAASVLAVDVEPSVVERARARYRRPGLEFLAVPDAATIGGADAAFDLVLVPDADESIRRPAALAEWKRLAGSRGAFVALVPNADRRGAAGGLGFYELRDALAPLFGPVRMFGQTPFLGFGIAEFDGADEALRVDSALVEGGSEEASHYVAVAGSATPLGYALVQIPFAPFEARLLRGTSPSSAVPGFSATDLARLPELEGAVARLTGEARLMEARVEEAQRKVAEAEARAREGQGAAQAKAELETLRASVAADKGRLDETERKLQETRKRLDEVSTQAESATRVARAQGDEIEELRGRLRRAADDRSELEGEVTKLRRALAQADESVANLTKRTAEEMEGLLQRLAAGVRSQAEADSLRERVGEAAALREETNRLRERLNQAEARALAAEKQTQERAGVQASDAAAALERALAAAARQREELDEIGGKVAELTRALEERDARITRLETERQEALWRASQAENRAADAERARGAAVESAESLAARDQAIEEFRRASAAHVEEATRLRATVADQSALVAELEDALREAESRAGLAEQASALLRQQVGQTEEADRTRRSRLSELEGKLLRLEREAETRSAAGVPTEELEELRREVEGLRARAVTSEAEIERWKTRADDGQAAAATAAARVLELEEALALARRSAEENAAPGVSTEELDRLRAALDKSEEQIWDAKEQIVAARERSGTLEAELQSVRQAGEDAERARQAAAERVRALESELSRAEAARALAETDGSKLAAPPDADRLRRIHALATRLGAAEGTLASQVEQLVELERAIALAGAELGRTSGTSQAAEAAELRRELDQKDQELQAALMEIDSVRTQSEERVQRLIADLDALKSAGPAVKNATAASEGEAEVILLHTTIANHRRRASKLREEVSGYRARAQSLSPEEVAGLLEEIGQDLGEFEK